jgi:hypothetical protein
VAGGREKRGLLDDLGTYDWVHGLIDADGRVRAKALARHHLLIDRWLPGQRRPTGTLCDLVGAFTGFRHPSEVPGGEEYQFLAPYGVLFLQWELLYPAEWRDGRIWSPWSVKEAILETFCARGPTPETGPALADLLLAAVCRVQRCQDRWYWKLARRIGDPALRGRLAAAGDDATERTRLRARFVLWVMDHPQETTGSAAWRRWLRSEGRPAAHAAALELAAMKPAAAASVLADLPPPDAAHVLEGLHAGPAGRILAAMRPVELAGRAAAQMDVRMAARALKAMEQPAAAAVLEAMDPAAAAARFPGISRSDLLLLVDTSAALARLRAMAPAAAGERLDFVPLQAAASLINRLDPDLAARIMAQMWRWDPSRLLPLMPPETAAALRILLRSDRASSDREHLDAPRPGE